MICFNSFLTTGSYPVYNNQLYYTNERKTYLTNYYKKIIK